MASVEETMTTALSKITSTQHRLVKNNARLENAVQHSRAKGLPRIAIGPAQGQFLSILLKSTGAKNILEIGTLGGYSTIWFAESSPDVKVTSIEFNPKHRDVAEENLKGLNNTKVILGAALDVLPKLAEEGNVYDFVFIDADWDEQQQYFEWAVKLSRQGGIILVDNAVRQFTDPDEGSTKTWALIEHVEKDDRVQASLVPTFHAVHDKMIDNVDGFLIALKK